ncbi:Ger(x)C family spore germination protein [Natranaerobius trueperi]|uniref:Ger(x)C family spore germination protein n=1 Tax=Natranaerobius trueperi TaxID=759412 RepID=UPI00197BF16E|nr:Ger(x)C family spore germination protein [Natranaerobius trueperi]
MCCLIIILLTSLLTGCWSRLEIDERALVMGVGVDETEEGMIQLSIQILLPREHGVAGEGGEGGEESVWVAETTGHTIFDATRNLVTKTGRDIFWQYSEIIVLGEDVAEREVERVLDAFVRDRDARLNQKVLVADGKASDIMNATHEQQAIPSDAVAEMVRAQDTLGKGGTRVTLLDFSQKIKSTGRVAFAPRIELVQEEGEGDELEGEELKISGIAIFDHEDRFASFLEADETRGVNWILGDLDSTLLVLTEEFEEGAEISFEMISLASKVEPDILEDGTPKMAIELELDGNIGEKQPTVDLPIEDHKKILEKKAATVVENEIKSALERTQKLQADVFGFGEAIHNEFPDQWNEIEEEWPDIFAELPSEVEVQVNIRRTGLIRDRFDE